LLLSLYIINGCITVTPPGTSKSLNYEMIQMQFTIPVLMWRTVLLVTFQPYYSLVLDLMLRP